MRVTIDIDERDLVRLGKIIAFFRKNYGIIPEVRVSSSGRGFHVIAYGLDISYEESLKIRKMLGDDANRVMLDESILKPKQVLFSVKNGKKSRVLIRQMRV